MKVVALAAVLTCAACAARPGADREVRRQRLEAGHRALVAQLEDLQARLLVGADRVRFWEGMRDRHESVSAIACTTQETHAVAMVEFMEREQTVERAPAPQKRQARVASLHEPEAAARRR